MNREEIISRVLAENSSETVKSPEELESMLNEELSKPENEIDYDLVDQLVTGTLEARCISLTETDIEDKRRVLYERNRKANFFKMPKWFIGAAAACLVLVFGNIYTVSAWDMNVFSFIVEFTKGGAIIDFKKTTDEIVLPTSEDDPYGMIAKCAEIGIKTETPHYIPDGFILKEVDSKCIDEYKYALFYFVNGKQSVSFTVDSYEEGEQIGIPSDKHNISEITVNGHAAVVSKEDNQMLVTFQTGSYLFTMFANGIDYDECDKILENIK